MTGFFLGADVQNHICVLDRTVELHARARIGLGKARGDVVHELVLCRRDAHPVDGVEVDDEDAAVEDREVLEQDPLVEEACNIYDGSCALENADEAILDRRREEPVGKPRGRSGGRDPKELQREAIGWTTREAQKEHLARPTTPN